MADAIATQVDPIFAHVQGGNDVGLLVGWVATMGFCFQLYFDFSSYSDMAIGLGRMFGIRLPLNFDSPFRQKSLTAVWRHWHMTLYRFFKDYIFIPLGGSENGPVRLYANVMIVMVISGVWHGSGWTFLFLGVANGLCLLAELEWRRWGAARFARLRRTRFWPEAANILTLLGFALPLPFFRAPDLPTALGIFEGMLGLNGFGDFGSLDVDVLGGIGELWIWPFYLALLAILYAWMRWLPSTQELMRDYDPALDKIETAPAGPMATLTWQPTASWAVAGGLLAIVLLTLLGDAQEFIYFQF